MKFLLKILSDPLVAALAIIVWICSGLLYCSATVLGFISSVIGFLGFLTLILYSVQNGLIILFIAFLISPIGLPQLAAWLLGQLQSLRYTIQDAVYH